MNAPIALSPNELPQYDALTRHAGLVDLGHRSQIELTGADRAAFLHNLSTNEVRKLSAGAGCETFLTTVQGKTLAHGFIFAGPESLVFETVAAQGAVVLKHLDHYLVSEQVTLVDRGLEWSELLLAGSDSEQLLAGLSDVRLPATRLTHAVGFLAGRPVSLRRVDWLGPLGFLISMASADRAELAQALRHAGAVACADPAFEAARIEWGFPLFGRDITDKNLPQEIARDSLAISFVKGCYLGQETVARIDALGHVNQTLVGVRFEGPEMPEPGVELHSAARVVGEVTSAAFSPHLRAPLALAFVRRGSNAPRTRLTWSGGEAEVVALPVR